MMRSMIRPFSLLLCLATLVLGGAPAMAEPQSYQVEVNKGKLIRLASPAASVALADPEIADAQVLSPKLIYLSGKKVGETSVLAVGKDDNVVFDGTVEVTHNLTKLKSSVEKILPGSHLDFTSTDNAIVLKGDVDSPYTADQVQKLASTFLKDKQEVVNFLNVKEGDQVMLKVKVAEVSRNALKRFGINIESLLSTGNFVFGLANGRDFINAAGTVSRDLQQDASILGGYRSGSANINTLIDALETDGLITVLAEPNLTTKSGMPANFLAGGEFPIPIVQDSGSGSSNVTIDYKQYGVSLDFLPTVLSKQKISLTVKPEVSTLTDSASIQANGFNIPSLLTRRASTTVELGSGESFAIAGLLRRDGSNDVSKVPALGDLPIIGALFRSTAFQQEQTELVIIVTPYIVRGVADAELATPVDGYKPASDFERILLGKMYGEEKAPDEHAEDSGESQPSLHGPAGFILR